MKSSRVRQPASVRWGGAEVAAVPPLEQIGLYQAVIDSLVVVTSESEQGSNERKGAVLAAITALKQICNHPVNYQAGASS